MTFRRSTIVFFIAAASACGPGAAPPGEPEPEPAVQAPPTVTDSSGRVEVLWDERGVPHIFAKDEAAMFFAFGWAQMESHGDLLLRLYGQARGRAAEYWGEEFVDSDRWVRVNGIPARAATWYQAQQPHIRAYLDAFAAGANAYGTAHPEALADAGEAALPITGADILAHAQRVINFTFIIDPDQVDRAARQWSGTARGDRPPEPEPPASNGWAIAPSRSADGHAMLLANPHLPWGDLFTWYEAQLTVPGMDAYGATLVGFPMPGIAFNDHLGWTHTVNTIDGADLYELTESGDGYLFDGATRAFETEDQVIRVRQADGTFRDVPLHIRRSVHGPVVAEKPGHMLALRVVGLDRPFAFEQTWRMLRATTLNDFQAALSGLQLPMFTVIYADRDGHIMHLFNGLVPVRPRGDWNYWQGIVPGDSSATLWTAVHPYGDLPRLVDPESGWLQNANDPPWTTTIPLTLDPKRYPAYMAPMPAMAFRPQRSARMLMEDESITFDELLEYKHSTRLEAADHILEDVIVAARRFGGPNARKAAHVLERWDRTADSGSRGAVLFEAFFNQFVRGRWPAGTPYDVPWTTRAPLSTPDGLSDPAGTAALLEATAGQVEATFGALDIAWGDVRRLRRDSVDLPGNGGPGGLGIFRVADYQGPPNEIRTAAGGDSYVAAIEFSNPVRAMTLIGYGNASQPGSPHRTDQLRRFARKELVPVIRDHDSLLARAVLRESF